MVKTRVFKVKSLVKPGYVWVVQEETPHQVPWVDAFTSRREAREWAKAVRSENR